MKVGYFPGCSLHGTGKEFDASTKAVAGPLDFSLTEVRDWNCCGATSAHATNHLLSIALPARNLALAEAQGLDRVLTPCAACYSRLSVAKHELAAGGDFSARVIEILQRPFKNTVGVVSVVEMLRDMAPTIKEKAVKPLAGLKVACYYGCLLVRPEAITGFDDPETPTSMETVVTAAGATPVAWDMRLECCGGGFSLSRTASVIRLSRAILESAKKAGADVLVVACPMCQSNLDFRQAAIDKRLAQPLNLPILYLTQLVGLALGLDMAALGLATHYVSPLPLLSRRNAPQAAATQPQENA